MQPVMCFSPQYERQNLTERIPESKDTLQVKTTEVIAAKMKSTVKKTLEMSVLKPVLSGRLCTYNVLYIRELCVSPPLTFPRRPYLLTAGEAG